MKSFSGCSETLAYVFLISDLSSPTSMPTSTPISVESRTATVIGLEQVDDVFHRLPRWFAPGSTARRRAAGDGSALAPRTARRSRGREATPRAGDVAPCP